MTEERDPYAVLEIPSTASPDEVATAYRAKARRHHPDVSHAADAEQRMAEVNAAWTLLRDPSRRAAWDRAHGITPRVGGRGSGAASAGGQSPRPAAGQPPGAGARPTTGQPWPTGATATPPRPQWRRGPDGEGAAGPPPGNPRGSVLPFGRHIGWSLGEIARVDPGYLAWLQPRREGAPYRDEIERLLAGHRASAEAAAQPPSAPKRKGRLFR